MGLVCMNQTQSYCGENHPRSMLGKYSDENGYFCHDDKCKFAYQSYPRNDKFIIR